MKKVTLYQVSKTDQVVSGGHLELRSYNYDQITPIRNSDEFLVENVHSKTTNLPIQKFVFNRRDWKTGGVETNIFYACFDDELLELIQCERGVLESLNSHNDSLIKKNLYLEDQWLISKTKLSMIAQMNWWKRIVFIFKGWKYDNGTQ